MTMGGLFYEPAIFFLSDCETSETGINTAVKELVEEYNATLSTRLFGDDNSYVEQILRGMSESGSGRFYLGPTGSDLETISTILERFSIRLELSVGIITDGRCTSHVNRITNSS